MQCVITYTTSTANQVRMCSEVYVLCVMFPDSQVDRKQYVFPYLKTWPSITLMVTPSGFIEIRILKKR